MNTQIHAARLILPPLPTLPNDPGIYWFASLDGQTWIETSDDPRHCTTEHIRDLMGLGARQWCPLKIDRSFLRRQGVTFLTGEKHA